MIQQLLNLTRQILKQNNMKIDINGVSITLTQDQLDEISRQTNKIKSFKDIKSFEIACEHQNIDVSLFNSKLSGLTKSEIAFRKLKIIIKAIRSFTNWKPNWSDSNQRKWRIWFDLKKGFSSRCGFSHYSYDCSIGPLRWD
jgi:hypothetical protein